MISFDEFQELSGEFNVIPFERKLMADLLTPVSTYLTMRRANAESFLLESVEPNEKTGRYSFVGVEPMVLLRSRKDVVTIRRDAETTTEEESIFNVVQRFSATFKQAPTKQAVGFIGGFVGYVGYDCVQHIERIPFPEGDERAEDDAMLGLFESVVCFDHRNHLLTIVVNAIVDNSKPLREQYEAAKKKLDTLELRLRNAAVATLNFSGSVPQNVGTDKAEFCKAVQRAKEYIVEGDIFQVVLSRRLQMKFSGDPFPVYRALRVINPSPYLFYLDFGRTKLIGSSPEVLVRSMHGTVELLPIAGTRWRGRTDDEDKQLEAELISDEKELAEHLMLVDLGRNDVGRICEYGSVYVPVFKRVERYSHVMHLVSEVKGRLQSGKSAVDVLKACFPAGTVSGAPKVRAMEIISELERTKRGVYAGAVGYFGFNGAMDTCIAIRTIVAHDETLSVQAGAGIVADSVPELEYKETVNKAQAMIEAIKLASSGLQL